MIYFCDFFMTQKMLAWESRAKSEIQAPMLSCWDADRPNWAFLTSRIFGMRRAPIQGASEFLCPLSPIGPKLTRKEAGLSDLSSKQGLLAVKSLARLISHSLVGCINANDN